MDRIFPYGGNGMKEESVKTKKRSMSQVSDTDNVSTYLVRGIFQLKWNLEADPAF
jgi:hypothetical protein